jgi:hypothetical protein
MTSAATPLVFLRFRWFVTLALLPLAFVPNRGAYKGESLPTSLLRSPVAALYVRIMTADSQRKKREQFALGNHIARTGIEMSPCSFCEKNGKKCVVVPSEKPRCAECVRIGKKCDVEGVPAGDWAAVEREEFRLDTAEMLAEDTLRKAQAEMNEAVNRLSRLRKQKQFLRKRAADMLHRGLQTIDELDAVEEKERKEKEDQDRPSIPPENSPGSVGFSGAISDYPLLSDFSDPSFWAGPEFSGETHQAAQGS